MIAKNERHSFRTKSPCLSVWDLKSDSNQSNEPCSSMYLRLSEGCSLIPISPRLTRSPAGGGKDFDNMLKKIRNLFRLQLST